MTKGGPETSSGLPKKKKHKVILEETIKVTPEPTRMESKVRAEPRERVEPKKRMQFKLMQVLWVISTELHLLCKAPEASFKALMKIVEDVLYVAYDTD